MFVDVSFFEVEDGMSHEFERDFAPIVTRAREMDGCLSSELVKLDEENRYIWVERWRDREAHNDFNQILFGQLLPSIPDVLRYAARLVDRDAEGYVVL
jgi:quinol monooxygenase YgiN